MASSQCGLRAGGECGNLENWAEDGFGGGSLSHAKEVGLYLLWKPRKGPGSGIGMVGSGFGKLPPAGGGVAHTWRCLGTSILWSLGTSAVPGAYLLVHRDRAQQVGAREE